LRRGFLAKTVAIWPSRPPSEPAITIDLSAESPPTVAL